MNLYKTKPNQGSCWWITHLNIETTALVDATVVSRKKAGSYFNSALYNEILAANVTRLPVADVVPSAVIHVKILSTNNRGRALNLFPSKFPYLNSPYFFRALFQASAGQFGGGRVVDEPVGELKF